MGAQRRYIVWAAPLQAVKRLRQLERGVPVVLAPSKIWKLAFPVIKNISEHASVLLAMAKGTLRRHVDNPCRGRIIYSA